MWKYILTYSIGIFWVLFTDLRPMHIYAARCGTIRFLLHVEQANFLYLVHLGDFFPAVFSKLTKYFQITAKVTRIVKSNHI